MPLLLLILTKLTIAATLACNGSPALCERAYNDITYPTTHNSTSTGFFATNQVNGMEKQLNDGIRAFMIDLYQYNDQVYSCHKFCFLGGSPISETLNILKKFLDQNPHEVLTILFESHVTGEKVESSFQNSKLNSYLYDPTHQKHWPTLLELIKANKRLLIFTEIKEGGPSWYSPLWDYAFDTSYSVSDTDNFDCRINRGVQKNPLFILNNFVTNIFGRKMANKKANTFSFIVERAIKCQKALSHRPNFIAVDFYETGEIVKAVNYLNQL